MGPRWITKKQKSGSLEVKNVRNPVRKGRVFYWDGESPPNSATLAIVTVIKHIVCFAAISQAS